MNLEANSGRMSNVANIHSPRILQESPLENQFPGSNAEFVDQMLNGRSLIEKLGDFAMFNIDCQRAGAELLRLSLTADPTEGLTRGEGKIVIVPGFASSKFMYKPTERFFNKLGFDTEVYMPRSINRDRGIARWVLPLSILGDQINIRPVTHTIEHFMEYLSRQSGKVIVMGHSKGGLLLVAAYATHRDEFTSKVKHMATVASARPRQVNNVIGLPYVVSQMIFDGEDFKFGRDVVQNIDIKNLDGVVVTAIGDPNDPILGGEMIGQEDDQIEVSSSHLGACVNLHVLRPLGRRFAELKAA